MVAAAEGDGNIGEDWGRRRKGELEQRAMQMRRRETVRALRPRRFGRAGNEGDDVLWW